MACCRQTACHQAADSSDAALLSGSFAPQKKYRWWTLAVFSYATFIQSMMFNTWGPIAFAAEQGFGWSDSELATVPNASNISALVVCFFTQYLVSKKGIRLPMLLATAAMFVGGTLWSVSAGAHLQLVFEFVLVGAVLNGISFTVYAAIPALVSALWFEPNQRTTATGIAMAASFLGDCSSFITGPLLVGKGITGELRNISQEEAMDYQDSVARVMYLETAMATLCLVLLLVYFPDAPPQTPSKSAAEPRLHFLEGMRSIARSKAFWKLNIAHNLPSGVFSAWSAMMALSMKPLGLTDEECGWIGFSSTLGSLFTSFSVARLTDVFSLKMKIPLHLMTSAALVSYLIVALLAQGYIQLEPLNTKVLLYIFCIIGCSSINGMAPLYYELACDCCFPVQEGVVGACLTASSCFCGVLFFIIFFTPIEGTSWMSWSLVSVLVMSSGLLVTVQEAHPRLDVDLRLSKLDPENECTSSH